MSITSGTDVAFERRIRIGRSACGFRDAPVACLEFEFNCFRVSRVCRRRERSIPAGSDASRHRVPFRAALDPLKHQTGEIRSQYEFSPPLGWTPLLMRTYRNREDFVFESPVHRLPTSPWRDDQTWRAGVNQQLRWRMIELLGVKRVHKHISSAIRGSAVRRRKATCPFLPYCLNVRGVPSNLGTPEVKAKSLPLEETRDSPAPFCFTSSGL